MNEKYYQQLLNCENLITFFTMFFGLGKKEQYSVLGFDYRLTKETKLYRIRRDDSKTDFHSPEAWLPPPLDKVSQGRFNGKNDQILYVASDPLWLEREVSLKQGEKYFLATYNCKHDFTVGTLLNPNNAICNILHCVAKSIESSSCLTADELTELNKYTFTYERVKEIIFNMHAPFYIYREVKKLYDLTNKIGKLVLSHNSNGIRYCSAFDPIEFTIEGTVFTLDGIQHTNFALTETGRQNIEFIKAEQRTCSLEQSLSLFFKTLNEEEKNWPNLSN